MKNLHRDITLALFLFLAILISIIYLFGCYQDETRQEFQKNQAVSQSEPCTFTLGDERKTPDLTVIASLGIDSTRQRFQLYGINPAPPSIAENGIVSAYNAVAYNWQYLDTFSAIRLWCMFENRATFIWDDANSNFGGGDFVFSEAQGVPTQAANGFTYVVYSGLIKATVFLNGEVVSQPQYKRAFEPSDNFIIGRPDSLQHNGVFHSTYVPYYPPLQVIHAQAEDIYINLFRIDRNTDGLYAVLIEVNPETNGCHAIRESNYDNNWFVAPIHKSNGIATYQQSAIQANIPRPVQNLNGVARWGRDKDVTLTWTSKAQEFTILRDTIVIAEDVYGNTFVDANLPNGWKKSVYTVIAENEHIGQSAPVSKLIQR